MTTTRMDNSIVLDHADAQLVSYMLQDYASSLRAQASKTRSAAVRSYCQEKAATASRLSGYIVRNLWTWTRTP